MRTVQFDRAACRWWNLRLAVTTAALRRPTHRRLRWTPTLIIVTVFVVSRVAAFAAGVRYDDGLLHNAYQLLDVRLLREQPFTSIFYLQSQPPLFNLFTAAIVQLPDGLVQSALAVDLGCRRSRHCAAAVRDHRAARHPPLVGRRRRLAVPGRSGDRSHRELVLLLRAADPRDRGRAVRAHPIRRRSSYVGRGALRQLARRLGAAAQLVPHRPDGAGARGRVAPALALASTDRRHRGGAARGRRRVVGQERRRVRQLDQQLVARHEPVVRRARGRVPGGLSAARRRRDGQHVGVPGGVPGAVRVHRAIPAPGALRQRRDRSPVQVDRQAQLQCISVHRRRVAVPARLARAAPPRGRGSDHTRRARGVHLVGGAR